MDSSDAYISRAFTTLFEAAGVAISMDGKGRPLDNVFIERLWWRVRYEHVYLKVRGYRDAVWAGRGSAHAREVGFSRVSPGNGVWRS